MRERTGNLRALVEFFFSRTQGEISVSTGAWRDAQSFVARVLKGFRVQTLGVKAPQALLVELVNK